MDIKKDNAMYMQIAQIAEPPARQNAEQEDQQHQDDR